MALTRLFFEIGAGGWESGEGIVDSGQRGRAEGERRMQKSEG